MDTRTQDRVEDWDPRPFSDGFDGLRDLADEEFTGAVDGGGTWLFMLNGRVVGVFDGRIEDFEDATGTVYRAPDPALVMLCTMWETGGDTKAKYYTNDTPIEEVDDTLSSGSFTGYIELSENVLSGDYYVCYYGGRSLPVAFVGNSEQLLTGSEAFDRANDEVGIYEVRDVDISVVEVPEPEDDDPDVDESAAGAAVAGSGSGESESPSETERTGTNHANAEAADPSESGTGERSETGTASDDGPSVTANIRADQDPTGEDDLDATPEDVVAAPPPDEDDDAATTGAASREAAASGTDSAARSDRPDRSDRRSKSERRQDETARRDDSRADRSGRDRAAGSGGATRGDRAGRGRNGAAGRGDRDARTDRNGSARETGERRNGGTERRRTRERAGSQGNGGGDPLSPAAAGGGEAESNRSEKRLEREAAWRETTTIPSIDPDNSSEGDATAADAGGAVAAPPADTADDGGNGTSRSGQPAERGGRTSGEPLEREMLEREDKIDRLQQQVSDLEAEREELRAEAERLRAKAEENGDAERLREENDRLERQNEQLRERVNSLESEVESLETEVDRLEAALEEAKTSAPAENEAPSGQQLSQAAAMSGTNLFVRYDSKGEDTLANAHSGTATKDDVNGNLRLEHHTSFDADDVVVGEKAYETFLQETIEFGFVNWVVRTLLFEIRDTGNQDALSDLYDTLPKVDRAELDGAVELDPDEESDLPAEIGFDVVLRNRMGAPLIVANVNDSRDPATEEMMVGLNEDANAVKEHHDELVGAFMVTTSFFSPGALETADEATSGSLLSRDSRKSFVKLSRKRGYHLCLVETRDGNFHVNVPEL